MGGRQIGRFAFQGMAVWGALTAGQLERMKQISRQRRGVASFDDPDVEIALQLTEEQSRAVRKILLETGHASGGLMGGGHGPGFGPGGPGSGMGGRPPPRGDRNEEPAADDTEVMVSIMKVLTPVQRQLWLQQLVGAAFVE